MTCTLPLPYPSGFGRIFRKIGQNTDVAIKLAWALSTLNRRGYHLQGRIFAVDSPGIKPGALEVGTFAIPNFKADHTMDTNLSIQYPLHLNSAPPLVLLRTESKRLHPALEQIYTDTFAHVNCAPAVNHPCVMLQIPTHELEPLLKEHWTSIGLTTEDVGKECLVLSLSSSFNGTAAAFAGQRPTVANTRNLDLLNAETYLIWKTCFPGETELTSLQALASFEIFSSGIPHPLSTISTLTIFDIRSIFSSTSMTPL